MMNSLNNHHDDSYNNGNNDYDNNNFPTDSSRDTEVCDFEVLMMNTMKNHHDETHANHNHNNNFPMDNRNRSNNIEVNDFDVLADELPGNVYDMDDYKKQIGNNRFDVLITMYQESFNQYYAKNNMAECDSIVQKIVQVTCRRKSSTARTSSTTTPSRLRQQQQQEQQHHGRFLVKTIYSINQWRELDGEESKQFVMQALRTPALDDIQQKQQQQQVVDLTRTDEGTRFEEEDDVFAPLPVTSKVDFSTMDIPSVDFQNMELSDNKKRGRRQSLLRRSASEDPMLLDKKKGLKTLAGELYRHLSDSYTNNNNSSCDTTISLQSPPIMNNATVPPSYSGGTIPATTSQLPTQQGAFLKRHHTVSDIQPFTRSLDTTTTTEYVGEQKRTIPKGGTIAHTIEGMDVVLTSDCQSFSSKPNIIGNNRLRVMLALEGRRFHTLSPAEQDHNAENLVKAVTEFWKGRVLTDTGFVYRILNQTEAVEAMKHLLNATPDHNAHNVGSGGISSIIHSAISTTTSSASTTGTSTTTLLPSSMTLSSSTTRPISSPLLAAAPPVPEFLRNASQAILNSGKYDNDADNLSGPEQMQSAAVRSIKERAGKRQMAKSSRSTSNGSKSSTSSTTTTTTRATNIPTTTGTVEDYSKETTTQDIAVHQEDPSDVATKEEASSATNWGEKKQEINKEE